MFRHLGIRNMKKSKTKQKKSKSYNLSTRKKKEQYFICPYCADLTTLTKILLEAEIGGPGFCDCQYTTLFWSPEFQDLDVDTNRVYHEYVEISKSWYDCLKGWDNEIIRRDAFKQIPGPMRLDNERSTN